MNPVSVIMPQNGDINTAPTYLFDHSDLYKQDPREAALAWFKEARYGLGIHYGLYSLIGKGERALMEGALTEDEYHALPKLLKANHFEANDIVEFAIANGMRYLNFNVRNADGFSLFNTAQTDFNIVNTPAHRDLLAELASVCEYHGIGLCLHYALGEDWHHAKGPRKGCERSKEDLLEYREFIMGQLNELLTQYGPIGAICFQEIEGVLGHADGEAFDCADLYRYVRHLQPQTLVAFEQGIHGSEDFFSCVKAIPSEDAPDELQGFIHKQVDKTLEIRMSLTPNAWGYHAEAAGRHEREEAVWEQLRYAQRANSNLLVNTALMPDGSLDAEDINTLLEIGRRIEQGGYPQ
ncbi:MAG: alpha-L-fucosidase [Victivallales bacterium]|nr:alpha-L-fucosidase [Victivallales bacterium]